MDGNQENPRRKPNLSSINVGGWSIGLCSRSSCCDSALIRACKSNTYSSNALLSTAADADAILLAVFTVLSLLKGRLGFATGTWARMPPRGPDAGNCLASWNTLSQLNGSLPCINSCVCSCTGDVAGLQASLANGRS